MRCLSINVELLLDRYASFSVSVWGFCIPWSGIQSCGFFTLFEVTPECWENIITLMNSSMLFSTGCMCWWWFLHIAAQLKQWNWWAGKFKHLLSSDVVVPNEHRTMQALLSPSASNLHFYPLTRLHTDRISYCPQYSLLQYIWEKVQCLPLYTFRAEKRFLQ